MQKLRTRADRSKPDPALRRLYERLFGPPALVAARRAEAFEAAYAVARERPALAADLLLETEQVDRRAGLRAGLRDGRTCRRHTSKRAANGGRADR